MNLKIVRGLSWILVLVIIGFGMFMLFQGYWPAAIYFLVITGIAIWFFRYDYKEYRKIREFEFLILLIVVFHIIGISFLYEIVPGSDKFLHIFASAVIGFFTFGLLKEKYRKKGVI